MNFLKRFSMLSVMLLVAVAMVAQDLPKVYILATGGTIAGSGSSATKSNYSRIHQGKSPNYLEYFVNAKPENIILDTQNVIISKPVTNTFVG